METSHIWFSIVIYVNTFFPKKQFATEILKKSLEVRKREALALMVQKKKSGSAALVLVMKGSALVMSISRPFTGITIGWVGRNSDWKIVLLLTVDTLNSEMHLTSPGFLCGHVRILVGPKGFPASRSLRIPGDPVGTMGVPPRSDRDQILHINPCWDTPEER